ncbi:MAG TPA: hypothetical protein VIK78_01990 [Ruminiclostridium sp.]
MMTNEFKKVYWKYYLILERDVLGVEPYVSFHPDNYYCFSNEFIKIYQAICSEIDVICNNYCKYINDTTLITGEYRDIRDYANYILTQHPEIVEQNVQVSEESDCKLVPWKEWHLDPNDHKNGKNPENVTPGWWRKYNDIKHRRSDKDTTGKNNYQHANLYNVLNSLAALYVLEKYFYADLTKDEAPLGKTPNIVLTPESKLFELFDSDIRFLVQANIGN